MAEQEKRAPSHSKSQTNNSIKYSTELFWSLLFHIVCLILTFSYVLLASDGARSDWIFACTITAFLVISFRHVLIHYEKPIEKVLDHAQHIQEGEYLGDEIIEGFGRLTNLSTLMRSFGADFAQVKYSYKTQVTDLHYQIEKSEAFYKAVLQSVDDAVVVFDDQGKIVAANGSASDLFRFEASLLSLGIDDLIFEKENETHVSERIFSSDPEWMGIRRKLSARRACKTNFPVYVTINRAQLDEECFFTAVITDISERTELKRQLSSMGAKLNAAIYSSVIGFGSLNKNGEFLDANQKFIEWVGAEDLDALFECSIFSLVHDEHIDNLALSMNQLLEGEMQQQDCEIKLVGMGKEPVWVFVSLSLEDTTNDPEPCIVFQATDITVERELTAQVESKNQELQQKNEDLDQFAYVASHDLKSPLNAIVKLISWIREDAQDSFDETISGHFELIESRAARMGNLLDSLLLYSRVGRKDYGYEQINFKQTVEELFELLDNSENFSLSCDELEVYVPLVPFQIVVRNLLSNAIKHHHTGKGNLTFKAREDSGVYVITATDDGPGIPEDLQSKALEVFQTLKPRDEVEGSGVGLPLIQKIVHRYGGTMQLQSDGQSGTTIALTWPIITPQEIARAGESV